MGGGDEDLVGLAGVDRLKFEFVGFVVLGGPMALSNVSSDTEGPFRFRTGWTVFLSM